MAEEAEKKNIAKLEFNIQDAINDLNTIDNKLKSIADSSEAYAKKISNSLNVSIDSSKLIDTKSIDKSLNEISNKKIKENANTNANILKNDKVYIRQSALQQEKLQGDLQKIEAKRVANHEKSNQQILNSQKNLADKIQDYAKTYIIYQGFNQLKQGIQETIDEMVEVEQQMVSIDRIMEGGLRSIDGYRDKLIQLAYDYGNSFKNVADITLRLAQAGFDENEALALTEKTLLALNTAELNATQATSDMVAVMAQWGLMTGDARQEAEDYGNIIDKINKLADNFPTTSADIMDALKKTSSAFKIAGADIDETLATIVATEKAAQRGGKVIGTALSNIIQQLKAEKKLDLAEELGLNFYTDASKTEFKPIMEIFEELSNRMQKLKDEGKESSVEMQSLLEMFTVFRRNIGSSLLGEMSGEDSTYAQAYKMSIDSIGYSLQENEKYMKTAKAAQQQFNAELLKLKTQIWDGGLETTFRDMLAFGTDLVKNISEIIDKFGVLPTLLGTIAGAYTVLNKKMQLVSYDTKTNSIQWTGFIKTIKDGTKSLTDANKAGSLLLTTINGGKGTFKNSAQAFALNTIEVGKFAAKTALATIKTVALQAATIALNAAFSMGLSFAITAVVSALDNWIHAQEKAVEKSKELKQESEDNAQKYQEEKENIQELREEYEKLAKKNNRTTEEDERIYELQTKINALIKDTGKSVELVTTEINKQGKEVTKVNDKYDIQLQKIKEVEREKEKARVKELKIAAEQAEGSQEGIKLDQSWWKSGAISSAASALTPDLYEETRGGKKSILTFETGFNQKTYKEQIQILTQLREKILNAEDGTTKYSDALKEIDQHLSTLNKQQENVNKAITDYNDALKELYSMNGLLIDYQQAINSIFQTYGKDKDIKNILTDLTNLNQQFTNGEISASKYFDAITSKIDTKQFEELNKKIKEGKELTEEEQQKLEGLQAIFAETTRFIVEGLEDIQNSYEDGEITFKQYLESLVDTNDSLLNMYATEKNLHYVQGQGWLDANNQIDEYATNMQNLQDRTESFIDVLGTLAENYEYLKENADAFGNVAFDVADMTDSRYQNFATNFGNSLAEMRQKNQSAWEAITQDIFNNAGVQANEIADVDAYVNNALKTNNENLNTAVNNAAKESQRAASQLATSTGNLISSLGETIANFKYNIKFTTSGSIQPGGNILNLATGTAFKPTSDLTIGISGSPEGAAANLGENLKKWGQDFNSYIDSNLNFKSTLETISPYVSKNLGKVGGRTPGGTGGTSGGKKTGGSSSKDTSDRDAERAAEAAKKAEEDAYKARLKAFEDYIKEKERVEKRWVSKYKELELLSTSDELYITQQRIERYKQYLDEVNKATWIKAEDRLKLQKEYSEEIEDLQMDYLALLKDRLDEEIKALEDANDKKIDIIKEEADKRIDAIKKVEHETDRIREKEEYEKKRAAHLEDISYWEQRTGREAQEALKEAKANLKELDEEWQKQLEDWSIEDQIQAIEDERDAQIKAIQDAQAEEIAAMQAVYDAKVKLFAETGQIIYEEGTIQSQKLFEAYKQNFIDPIKSELENLNKVQATTTPTQTTATPAPQQQQYEAYTIRYGDTLTSIARKFGTTIEKIMAANPYVTNKNKIYSGKTLQIPKFHDGGIFGGSSEEGLALLKKGEVILKPSWSASLDRMMHYFDNLSSNNQTSITNGPTINVDGDLIRVEANIKNQSDINTLERKLEKMLKDKFNIKK